MKPVRIALMVVLLCLLSFSQAVNPIACKANSAGATCRQRVSFNDGWLFYPGDPADGGTSQKYSLPDFYDKGWRKLALPHDWAVEGKFGKSSDWATGRLISWGPVWYRKHFQVATANSGKRINLEIDGAMSNAQVWLNGQLVGGWPYGYSSFELDLTPYLKFDADNVIAVRLDSPPDSSRWYPGAGIYRNVWLSTCKPLHIAHWGTFLTTPEVSSAQAKVAIKIDLQNEGAAQGAVAVRTDIYPLTADGTRGNKVASVTTDNMNIGNNKHRSLEQNLIVDKPLLWNTTAPQRYLAVTNVSSSDQNFDSYETPFGIRTIKFDPKQGFMLNGEHVRLNGVCDHHDLGALGAALNESALKRQLTILKEMGCNAIRTSHNPPAPELLDLCDRMGFVVMDESFDCWVAAKRSGDYHLLFPQWHEKDLSAQIHRDRNHPCVILWSIGNEIEEQGSPKGHEVARQLADIVHREDTTRPVTAACHNTAAGYNGFEKTVDVFGYNYKPHEYSKFHKVHPDIPLFGSETASCVSSRGEYFFPVTGNLDEAQSDFQVSSYDLVAPGWATSPDAEFKGQDENPCVAGEFVWTGFDYLGEPTPFDSQIKSIPRVTDPIERGRLEKELKETGKILPPSRSSYFGIVDLAGFKKDRFYLYQARWCPDLPMAHILPHWNWPERKGLVTPVHVYTSGDEAELFLNGRSLGRKKKGQYEYRLRWDDVVYEPGQLKVVAYKDGKEWARDTVKTRGAPVSIALAADQACKHPKSGDLIFVTATINDKDKAMVPRAKNEMQFAVEGAGQIVATDNGDATDISQFSESKRKAFNGKCLVIVRATGPGVITLRAYCAGLKEGQVRLVSK